MVNILKIQNLRHLSEVLFKLEINFSDNFLYNLRVEKHIKKVTFLGTGFHLLDECLAFQEETDLQTKDIKS